jgi:hypothetical protein
MRKERVNPYEQDSINARKNVNKKEQWIQRNWDKARLLKLVSYGMRIRFEKAEMLYKESLFTADYKNISKMAEMMVRGYEALIKEATDLGHLKLSATTWLH